MLTFAKVATPLAAATVVVPASVPLAGFVPIATVMLVVAVVTVLPWASSTATCTAGVLAAPATALLGCTVKTSFAAAPALMVDAPRAGAGAGAGGAAPALSCCQSIRRMRYHRARRLPRTCHGAHCAEP